MDYIQRSAAEFVQFYLDKVPNSFDYYCEIPYLFYEEVSLNSPMKVILAGVGAATAISMTAACAITSGSFERNGAKFETPGLMPVNMNLEEAPHGMEMDKTEIRNSRAVIVSRNAPPPKKLKADRKYPTPRNPMRVVHEHSFRLRNTRLQRKSCGIQAP